MNKKIIRPVVVIAAIAAIIFFAQKMKNQEMDNVVAQPIRPVKTQILEDVPVHIQRVFPGHLSATQTADLSFEIAGQVVELPIREGMELKEGSLIARLDQRDALNRYNSALANFEKARADLERYSTLFEEEMVAASEFELKQRDYDVTVAGFNIAAKALEDTEIRSPFDGKIARRYIENFERIQAKQNIVTLQDDSNIDIVIDVPETTLAEAYQYEAGYVARFPQKPSLAFPLELKEFSTIADPHTKTYAITLTMPWPDDNDIVILSDMTVSIEVNLKRIEEQEEGNFVLPSTAIVYNLEKEDAAVWVLDPASMLVSARSVIVVGTSKKSVTINGDFQVGNIVIVAGGSYLNEGQKVRRYEDG